MAVLSVNPYRVSAVRHTPFIQKLFSRFLRQWRAPPETGMDVDAAAPLTQLVKKAEPASDLFEHIEARIDSLEQPHKRRRSFPVAIAFCAGLCCGALAVVGAYDRYQITDRDGTGPALGRVTLHGVGLRALMRASCHGEETLLIIIRHQPQRADRDLEQPEGPSAKKEEKVLLHCIF